MRIYNAVPAVFLPVGERGKWRLTDCFHYCPDVYARGGRAFVVVGRENPGGVGGMKEVKYV
jgi:hypothetical protein